MAKNPVPGLMILLISCFVTYCSTTDLEGSWRIDGENLRFTFNGKDLSIYENQDSVLKGRLVATGKSYDYRIVSVGKNAVYQKKYQVGDMISFSQWLLEDDRVTLYIKTKHSEEKHILSPRGGVEKMSYFALLHPSEQIELRNDSSFRRVREDYQLVMRDKTSSGTGKTAENRRDLSNQPIFPLILPKENGFLEFFFIPVTAIILIRN
ncbi:MAG: hypothetical protein OEZ36_14070 [Spirochaetota bacterium]|nr:hypothetical protein [Spirochaetota bacterium]